MRTTPPVDKWFLRILATLVAFGFLIFTSASLGLLARDGARYGNVTMTQFIAILLGASVAYLISRIDYHRLRQFALPLLLLSSALTLLVFIPGIGFEHGGANRWIAFGSLSFQPSELLKIAFVIYAAAFFSAVKAKIATVRFGLIPLIVLAVIAGVILLAQPDTDTFMVLFLALVGMFLVAGGKWKHLFIVGIIGLLCLSALVWQRPYLRERLLTYLDPSADPLGAGYQIQQSLIAIGSGGFTGKGFGQSVQKFSYLPEPIGDSIFAVAGEEFGFIGGILLIGLYLAFLLRGLRIATGAPDRFGGLLSLGIVILIGAGAFMNIAAMLSIIPLSGLPLSFVSHGGTALLFTMAEAGILLNVSRQQGPAS